MGSRWIIGHVKGFLSFLGLAMAFMAACCGGLVLDYRLRRPPPPNSQNVEDYLEVIELVERGDIQPNDRGWADLPAEYQRLSDGGQIWVLQETDVVSVLFWRSRGILGEGVGYVYRSDDSPPAGILWCDEWETYESPGWFLCVSE